MSSTTLILAVTGGVFCGASLIGAAMILFLWVQMNNQKSKSMQHTSAMPSQPQAVSNPVQTSNMTLPPTPVPPQILTQAPPNPPALHAGQPQTWLDGIGGMITGQRIMLDRPQMLIGRSGVCDIQFHDPKISRQHAVFRLYEGQYQLEDMRSTGGTFVNGKRVTVHRLRDHDQIRIGDSVVVFRQQ